MLLNRAAFKSLGFSLSVVLALLIGLLALACTPGPKPAGQPTAAPSGQATAAAPKVIRGGTIRTFGVACPDLDLSKTWCSPHSDALNNVYRGLLKWRSDTYYDEAVQPDLAESWEVTKDGLAITFKIRKGMKFPDVAPVNGREFEASDVAFNIDMVKKDNRLVANLYKYIESYSMPDKYTIVLKLSKPYGPFATAFGTGEAGLMFTREIYERDGGFSKNAVGVGPFYLKNWESNVELETQRNPNYWEMSEVDSQRLPYVNGYKLLYLRDDASRLAAFRAKRMDQWYAYGFPPLDDVESLKKTNPDAVIVEDYHSSWGSIGFNVRRPPLDTVKARQAVMFAIDFDSVIEQAWVKGMRGEYFHPKDKLAWSQAEIKQKFPYDPKKAAQLWKEAGLEGSRPIKYITRQEGTQGAGDIKSAQVVVQMLNEAGIKAELMVYQDMAQSAALNRAGDWDFGGAGGCSGAAPGWNLNGTWGVHFVGCRKDNSQNYWGPDDPKIDEMADAALFEPDPEKAATKWKALRDYVYSQVYSVQIGAPARWNIDQPWIHYKVKSRQHSGSRTEGMERAWLDEKYTGER